MGFADDFKEDQTLQIQVVCVAFFLVVFPTYFFMKAAATDDPSGMGGVGTYTVTAEFSYIDFDSGEEEIADGETYSLDLIPDSIPDIVDKNIVGVLLSMNYGEDETGSGAIQCVGPNSGQNAPDTITGTASYMEDTNTSDGQNQGGSGSHAVITQWYNSSMIGEEISGFSESEITSELDFTEYGTLGTYSISIAVEANAGNGLSPGCDREDLGETVSFTVQLIVLDYDITPYIDIEDL